MRNRPHPPWEQQPALFSDAVKDNPGKASKELNGDINYSRGGVMGRGGEALRCWNFRAYSPDY